jgi:hypothetical protein
MAENKIIGYKNIFGFVLPDWVDEGMIRMMVTFLLSAAAMMFVLIFLIWPKFADVNQLKSNVSTKTSQLESLKSSKAGFDTLNDQIPEAVQNSILQAIPQTYSPENAVFLLRSIAEKTSGVIILSYSLPSGVLFDTNKSNLGVGGNNNSMANFVSYPIKLSVSAPVDKLLEFINRVETSLPVGIVSDLGMQEVSKLSKSVDSEKSIKMDLEIMYYQAVLKQMDISKVSPFTDADMILVNKISGFSPPTLVGAVEVPAASNTTGNLFGF